MKNLTNLICFIFFSTLTAQSNFNSDDIIVTRADIETNVYEKDSTANALVIYESGNSYVDKNSFKLITQINKKIKILNRNGFHKSTIEIYLYNNNNRSEKAKDISATTFNLESDNVTKTKLSKSEIFEEKYNDNYNIVKFTCPNIKEGSVINFSYTLETPFMYKYHPWNFQDDIPKLYSEYKTSIPGNWEYNIKLVGYLKLSKNHSETQNHCLKAGGGSANCTNTTYAMKDIPAFIPEDYMTTKNNYLSRIEYELKIFRSFDGRVENITKSWKTADSELKTDQNLGRQLGKSGMLKGLIDESIINEVDPVKKAKAIYKYVQDNYTWNEKYRIFSEVSVKDLIKNKSGNVSEINILLHNLLEEHNIEVLPVLMSTRNNGLATKIYPVISDFNYLIVQATINGKTYLLDATDKYLSFGEIPFRCLNQYGRLLDFDNKTSWIDINPDKPSIAQYKVSLNLDENELLTGNIEARSTGYHALPLKKGYYTNSQDYFKYYKEKYNNIEFIDHSVTSEDKTSYEFSEVFNLEYTSDVVGGNLYINPFLFTFFDENPFKLQERSYPIDFGFKDAFLYTAQISFDDTYEVLEIPKDLIYPLPNNKGRLIFNSKVEGNSVMLYFKFTFNEAIFDPAYYDALKKYIASVIDIQKNSLIVLKKK